MIKVEDETVCIQKVYSNVHQENLHTTKTHPRKDIPTYCLNASPIELK